MVIQTGQLFNRQALWTWPHNGPFDRPCLNWTIVYLWFYRIQPSVTWSESNYDRILQEGSKVYDPKSQVYGSWKYTVPVNDKGPVKCTSLHKSIRSCDSKFYGVQFQGQILSRTVYFQDRKLSRTIFISIYISRPYTFSSRTELLGPNTSMWNRR